MSSTLVPIKHSLNLRLMNELIKTYIIWKIDIIKLRALNLN